MSENGLFQSSINELNALVSDTEDCANKIFEACEEISSIIKNIDNADTHKAIVTQLSNIFEAGHFQDFSGQRASKVISNIEEARNKVGEIEADDKEGDEALKQGPQLDTANQDDIDKLFEEA